MNNTANSNHNTYIKHEVMSMFSQPTQDAKFPLPLTFDELMAMPDQEWVIAKLIAERSFNVIYGAPKSGKTFAALALASHITSGTPFLGNETKKGTVIYVAAEGAAGLKKRVRAEAKQARFNKDNFLTWTICPNLLSLGDVSEIIKKLQNLPKEYNVKLIVIDTLARTFGGESENDIESMARFVLGVDAIKNLVKAPILVIHHSGKDSEKGMRGSSVLLGACDCAIEIRRTDTGRSFTVKAQKDEEELASREFWLNVVDDTCIVEFGDVIEHQPTKQTVQKTYLSAKNGDDYDDY